MKKSEYQKLHRELWQWLADNPDKEKINWPRWEGNGDNVEIVMTRCFPCGYFKDCILCEPNIVAHGDNDVIDVGYKTYAGCLNGLYLEWDNCAGPEQRTALALQIKDLW